MPKYPYDMTPAVNNLHEYPVGLDPKNPLGTQEQLGTGDVSEFKGSVDGSAGRYNANKLRLDLIPPQIIEALAQVYTHGAKKYAANNWKKGMPWMDVLASAERHLLAWKKGATIDGGPNGSGLTHLSHLFWNIGTLMYYEMHPEYRHLDDRPFKEGVVGDE